MRNRHKFIPAHAANGTSCLELLEQRLVLSSTYNFTISLVDLPLSLTSPTPVGYDPVVSDPAPEGTYTLRQLVYFYDKFYNSSSTLTLDLDGGTYNFNAPGRGENDCLTGDLDVYLGGGFASNGALAIQNGTINGKLNGVMAAATPSG
jgi:hypothetical protein